MEYEIRTRPGRCPTHGDVSAEKKTPKLGFPYLVTAAARARAQLGPYRCPTCGTKVQPRS